MDPIFLRDLHGMAALQPSKPRQCTVGGAA
jgi:hypothetical protein